MNTTITPETKPASRTNTRSTRHSVQVLELRGNLGSMNWQGRSPVGALANSLDDLETPGVVVDLSEVGHGGAEMLRFLVNLRRRVLARGGEVVLTGLSDDLAEVLSLANLDRVFSCYHDVEEGVAALRGERF